VAHAIVAFGGYLLFGGWRLFGASFTDDTADRTQVRFERTHWITLAVIAVVLVPVLTLKAHIGLASFAGATVLAASASPITSMRYAACRGPRSSWCAASACSSDCSRRPAVLDLFSSMLARFATESTLPAFVALVTAVISVYSSTSSVVLPAFLPTVPRSSCWLVATL
jgi:hypothetical protein